MSQSRQLAAIMFTDIVGFTALMGSDEKKTFDILEKNRKIHKPIISTYNGRWIKELGDGVMASFSSVTDAVYAAIKIQEACNHAGDFLLRIGIHHGEIIIEDNDIFGDTVNIASRLQAIAPPGGIYISESVERNIKNKKDIKYVFVNEEKLKHIEKPEKIFQIVDESADFSSSPAAVKDSQKAKSSHSKSVWAISGLFTVLVAGFCIYNQYFIKKPSNEIQVTNMSIAVLPFKLIGTDEDGKYFAEGVADVLINHLHGIGKLKVRSRTSVEQYRYTKKMVGEIAKELKVDYIIEGSAQKYNDDIRIIVQLINPKTDDHIWKNEYNKKFKDILNVQSEIALQIVKELNVIMAPEQKLRIEKIYTKNPEAWDLYLRGKEYSRTWWKFGEINDANLAIDFFTKALKMDTAFALAAGWLASTVRQKESVNLLNNQPLKDSVLNLIQKSIRLDPDFAMGYRLLGDFYAIELNDVNTGLLYYDKAIQMDPNDQTFHIWKGNILANKQNKHLQALSIYNDALKREPSDGIDFLLSLISFSYLCVGEFDQAFIFIEKALDLYPDNLYYLSQLSHMQQITGRFAEYQKTINKSISIRKDNMGLVNQGKAYLLLKDYLKAEKSYQQFFSLPKEKYYWQSQEKHAYAQVLRKLGKEKEALKYIYEAKHWIEENSTDPNYDLAKVYSFLGEKKLAIDYLNKWKPNWGVHVWVEKDPLFENIQNESEFKQLVQRFKTEISELTQIARQKIARREFPTIDMIR